MPQLPAIALLAACLSACVPWAAAPAHPLPPPAKDPPAEAARNPIPRVLCADLPGNLPLRGAMPFFVLYQDSVPGAASGRLDPARVVAAIRKAGPLPEFGMLDFEDPYSMVLREGASHPRHAETVRTMLDTLAAVKAAFPRTKWTYWGFPELPFWLEGATGSTWATAGAPARDAATRAALAGHRQLLLACDWVSPWAYDMYDARSAAEPRNAALETEGTRAWIAAKIAVARAVFRDAGRPMVPVIPCVSPLYAPGGRAEREEPVPLADFRRELIDPMREARVDGVALWHPLAYVVRSAVEPYDARTAAKVAEHQRWLSRHIAGAGAVRDWGGARRVLEPGVREFLQRYVDAIASE